MMTIEDFQKAFQEVQKEMRMTEEEVPDKTGYDSLDAYMRGLNTGILRGMIIASKIFYRSIRMPGDTDKTEGGE